MTPPESLLTRLKKALAWRIKPLRERIVLARAHAHRRRLNQTIFLGVTGSAGKTTTKDLAVAILQQAGPTTGNPKSLNYLLDVALLLLQVKRSDRFTVVEIAASGPNTLDGKLALTRPHVGALTVVQRDHIKNFDSLEAIAEEKGKLIFALPTDGTAVLNIDDPLVRKIGERATANRLWFGTLPEADIRLVSATSVYPEPLILELEYQGRRHTCTTSLHGTHLATATLAAIGMGIAVGIPMEQCIKALAAVTTTDGRMQIITDMRGVTFIRDDFKAPYWSFQPALDYLKNASAKRKVAVIGTLSDYSLSASKLYPKVARNAMEAADLTVFVGPHAMRALKSRRNENDRSIIGFTETEDAHHFLESELREGDLVLLKGSNRADHLVRLFLARRQPVTCWTRGCGYNRFCDVCPKLNQPSIVPPLAAPASTRGKDDIPQMQSSTVPSRYSDAWFVVGLGNEGAKYKGTPHNIGFEVVDRLADRLGGKWSRDAEGETCEVQVGGERVVLLKPGTAINLCGEVIARVAARGGIMRERFIVIHDDNDLPLGDARVKRDGSDGGHKGLRSVISAFRNSGFMVRVRVGVSIDQSEAKTVVLTHFGPETAPMIEAGLDKAMNLLSRLITAQENTPTPSRVSSDEAGSQELTHMKET